MKQCNKWIYSLVSLSLVFCAGISRVQAANFTLPNIPIFIKETVEPNILVTLDDSGSMAAAFIPDSIANTKQTRRFKSSSFNPIYFNPATTYTPPKNEQGISYSTRFDKAWKNGFVPDLNNDGVLNFSEYVNLSSNYRPAAGYNPADKADLNASKNGWMTQLADNPSKEFGNHNGTLTDPIIEKNHVTSGVHAYYYEFNTSSNYCNGTLDDEDCYDYKRVTTTQEQNFANWFSFYRTRAFATASAASLIFQPFSNDIRIGWQNLNRCKAFSTHCEDYNSNHYDSRIRAFTGIHRQQFFNWLKYAPTEGGSPLRSAVIRAGELLEDTSLNSPYAKIPGTIKNPMYECRASYHLAMSDGIWNTDKVSSYGNYDSSSAIITPGGYSDTATPCTNCYTREYAPQSFKYSSPGNPYDKSHNTVSDIVFKQWITDSQPSIINRVPTYMPEQSGVEDIDYWNPKNNPAEWQHMTTFMAGLGLTKTLTDPAYAKIGVSSKITGTFGGGYDDIINGIKAWPVASKNTPSNTYDLWHSAINGRGKLFRAEDPGSLINALKKVVAGTQNKQASVASTALDSSTVNGLSFAYYANFFSHDWSGDLQSFELLPPHYEPAKSARWSAQDQLAKKAAVNRKIMMSDASGKLIDFLFVNLSTTQLTQLNLDANNNIDTLAADRVLFLRGDNSDEGSKFRVRGTKEINGLIQTKKLGDIVHSSPVYVAPPSRQGYDKLEGIIVNKSLSTPSTPAHSYNKFITDNTLQKKLIFVGANDGMLHAFNTETGNEHFAFIPSAVFPNLRQLSYKDYTHQYFVDGANATGDIYDSVNSKWRTIVVSSLRSGGKSTFALDVTDPDNIELLWEFTDTDLGYSYSKPEIVRLHNGKWGVLVSNGYNSTHHKAVMYALDAVTGEILKKFDTGTGTFTAPNGLAEPSPVDINGDLIIDYVYAGDIQGNVWRFDLIDTALTSPIHKASTPALMHPRNNAAPSTWSIGYGGTPLFVAKDPASPPNNQPITSNIVAAPHSSGKGILVMFGTGKYIEASDATPKTTHTQSYYGIWDRYVLGEATTSTTLSEITRNNLQEQTLSTAKETTRKISKNKVEWYDYSTSPPLINKQGWYIDFINGSTATGELLASKSAVIGNIVSFATTIPSINPCSPGVERWIWALDIQSGGRTKNVVFDLNNDKTIDHSDLDASGVINNSIKTEGMGAISTAGDVIYLNQKNSITPLKINTQDSSIRRSWRMIR